jgi:hypothetical protein
MATDLNSKTQTRKRGFSAHGGQHRKHRKGGGLNSHWGGFIDPRIAKTDPLYPFGHSKRHASAE